MTLQPAGTELDYTVTYLEMTEPPAYPQPHLPANLPAALLRAEAPPAWYFMALYDAVGRDYAWEDLHEREAADLAGWLADPAVALWTLMGAGWPHGFFVLDERGGDVTDLTFFGLVPEAIGRGLGTYLLRTAVHTAWARAGLRRMTVNTCTLDHPRALQTYQKNGFSPVRRETRRRVLTRPRDLSRIPE